MKLTKLALVCSFLMAGAAQAAETVVQDFSKLEVGATVDKDSGATNVVSDEFASDTDGQSWKIDYTAAFQGTTLWGEWNWESDKFLEIDVLNNSGETLQVAVKLISLNTDWGDSYNLYTVVSVPSSETVQTVAIDLDGSEGAVIGDNYKKAGVGGIQMMLQQAPSKPVTIFVDNLRADDGVEEEPEPEPTPDPEPTVVTIESFADMTPGTELDDDVNAPSNMVSADAASDGDTLSMRVDFEASYKAVSLWDGGTPWNWSDKTTLKFDVLNDSGESIIIAGRLITSGTDWSDAYNLMEATTLETSDEFQTVEVNLDSNVAGSKFTKESVGGIQFMLHSEPTADTLPVYIDNIRVDGKAEVKPEDPETPKPTPEPDPKPYKNEGGSLGGFALMLMAAVGILRRRK